MIGLPKGYLSIATVVGAVGGGWLMSLTDIPLAWMIGAMLSVVAMSLLKLPIHPPDRVMSIVKASVGTMLGASVTVNVVASLATWWPSFVFMAFVMIGGGILNFYLMRRLFSFGQIESALCAVPGGIAEMILLSETAGGEQWRVALVHALRIALAILLIPVIVGWVSDVGVARTAPSPALQMSLSDWGWFLLCVATGVFSDRFKRIPARLILVPMALCAGLHLTSIANFSVPTQISNVIQIFIGINVGARFAGVAPRLIVQVGLAAVVVVAVQILLAVGAALCAAHYMNENPLALVLSYSPGGLAEMSLIAVALGQEVAIVGFHHIARVLGALFAAPAILKKLERRP